MSLEWNVSGFMGAMDAAARYIGAGDGSDAALRGELGKVLQRAVDYTHAPEDDFEQRTRYGLTKRFNSYAAGEISTRAREITPRISYCPGKGEAFWIDAGGKGSNTLYIMNRGPRKNWGNRYQRYLAEEHDRQEDLALELQQYLPKVLKSRGLTKQSWWQIGQALGIEVPGVPAFVKAAIASDGQSHINGTGTRTDDGGSLVYRLTNSMPTLISPRKPGEGLEGEGILSRAFASRETAIMIALEKGVFDDLEKAIKRFPGLALLR